MEFKTMLYNNDKSTHSGDTILYGNKKLKYLFYKKYENEYRFKMENWKK